MAGPRPVWVTLFCIASLRLVAAQDTLGPLRESQVYHTDLEGNSSYDVILAPQAVLGGAPVGVVAAGSTADCAVLCRATDQCWWFNHCPTQGGCRIGGTLLEFQGCQLLAPSGTVVPQVTAAGPQVTASSGFLWREQTRHFPGFTTVRAKGMEGSDYPCPGSVLPPDQCAFRTEVEAAIICMSYIHCRTIVVYLRGIDGASPLVAVLKSANLAPGSTLVSPLLYSITRLDNLPITATHLYRDDGTTILPTAEETAANSSWQGCFIGRNAAIDGVEVTTLTEPSAEGCCRTCRLWGANPPGATPLNATSTPSTCNCFNWCGQAGGCRLETEDGVVLELAQHQCQLRFQTIIEPSVAYPAALVAKGPHVPFQSGGPIVTTAQQLPGYTLLPGMGLFTYGRFSCQESLRPEIQECVRQGAPQQLASFCDQDSQCTAFIMKQQGVYGGGGSLGIFKHHSNSSAILWNPTGLLYLRNNPNQGASAALSAREIAGVAVGSTAAVAVLAGITAWAFRRRQRHRLCHTRSKSGASDRGIACGEPTGAAGKPAEAEGVAPAAVVEFNMSPCALEAGGISSEASTLRSLSPQQSLAGTPAQPNSEIALEASVQLPAEESVVLPELVQLVIDQDTAASHAADARQGATPPTQQPQQLSAAHLPPGLADFVVEPCSITYCRLPNGKLHEIGSGASGKVYKAIFNGEYVAAKEIEVGTNPERQRTFVREAVRLHQLRHAAVVGFVGVAVAGDKGVLLLELCEGRDLFHALSLTATGTRQRLFGWYRLGRRVALDLARALNYLHSKGFVHMDVKSSNVLLTASGAAKLGDVGVAVMQTRTFLSGVSPTVGTYAWAAPEVLLGQQCTASVDIFSYGVVLWEIVTGEQPSRGRLRAPHVPQECPQEVADLIARCTASNPQQRPTAKQLLQQLGQLQRMGLLVGRHASGSLHEGG